MAKNKNLLAEALKEAEAFNALMAENTSNIFIKHGLENAIDEAIDDEDGEFDETDVDAELDADTDVDTDDTDVDVDVDTDVDTDVDDLDVDTDDIDFDEESEEGEIEFDDEDESDEVDADLENDVVVDMTDSSNDEIIQVFKKMSDDDEIEIVDDTVKITDPESGNEYKVEMNGSDDEDIEFDDEEVISEEFDFGFDIDELDSLDDEESFDDEEYGDMNPFTRGKQVARDQAFKDMNDDHKGEITHDFSDIRYSAGTEDVPLDNVKERPSTKVNRELGYNKGIDLDEVPGLSNPRHDHTEPGFDEDPLFEIEIDDEETIDEQIPVGLAKAKQVTATAALDAGIGGAGAYEELKEAYNKLKNINAKLLSTAKELANENTKQRKALMVIKERIEETKVYTQNTNAVSRLFIEHSTTKAEKEAIVDRFKNVKTINESINLEKQIKNELTKRGALTESVKHKMTMNINSSVSKNTINESIVDPQIARARKLM